MFSLNNISKYFLLVATTLSVFVAGICCFFIGTKNSVYALDGDVPEYFVVKNNETSYVSGDTIFLDTNQKLSITMGKPKNVTPELTANSYTNQDDIGNYALSFLDSSMKLQINGVTITNTEPYFTNNLMSVVGYTFIQNATTSNPIERDFSYFEMSIDLSQQEYFPTGEYIISFTGYTEFNGTNFPTGTASTKSFEVKYYIFNTQDYFISDSATTQKVTFENVSTTIPTNASYKNYYYFNYSNIEKASTTTNYIPALTFSANKFSINITKSIGGGIQNSCIVNGYSTNLITLVEGTTKEFISAKTFTDPATNEQKITIYFRDIGDYKISYDLIYINQATTVVTELTQSEEIINFQRKSDILYIYGYQMFYSGTEQTLNNEFKVVDDKGEVSGITSADVSYKLSSTELITVANPDTTIEDDFIANILASTPASTNQPAITTKTNANLIENHSYYYTLDKTTNDWAMEDTEYIKTPYKDHPFTESGTYLLKVVYTFDNYYNENNVVTTQFTQFFYFKITNTTPSLTIQEILDDNSTKPLSTNAFTNHSVQLILESQSLFNSPVKVNIYAKAFTATTYNKENITRQIIGTTNTESTIFEVTPTDTYKNYNRNYLVELVYGPTLNKVITSYFTIDDTEFNGVQVLPIQQSLTTSLCYIKNSDNPVEFFTDQNVALEWNEKPSGASSQAYYKYIPFVKIDNVEKDYNYFLSANGIPTNYALQYSKTSVITPASYINTKNYSLLTSDMIFTNQGFYIVYLKDSAGNEKYVSFCIDRTDIVIWQTLGDNYDNNVNLNNNVVVSDTTLQWGKFKYINLNLSYIDVQNKLIADPWIQKVLYDKLITNQGDNDVYSNSNNQLSFAVEISSIMVIQSGNSYQLIYTSNDFKTSDTIELLETNVEINYTFAKELTYVYYFIDESNTYFDSLLTNNVFNNTVTPETFIQNSSLAYRITTSSDASNATLLVNNTTIGVNDVSMLSNNSYSLSQAGFTDSKSYNEGLGYINNDLRSKYYNTTGSTQKGDIPLLSYIYKVKPSDGIYVASIQVLFYAFEIDANGVYRLTTNAIDITGKVSENEILYGGVAYKAFNINPEYDVATGIYQTIEGKYVIVRTYNETPTNYNYDFLIRESVFTIDRQEIVSNPENVNNEYKSYIGGDIYINVFDGLDGSVKFKDIYSAKNNTNYILKTNKLPVVVYIPLTKYGVKDNTAQNYASFTPDQVLSYYYTATKDNANGDIFYLKRFTTDEALTQSQLFFSYFGTNASLVKDFTNTDTQKTYRNNSFDLSVKITDNNGTTYYSTLNVSSNNYWLSTDLTKTGIYYVEITQNATNGVVYPNVYKTFKFTFQIIEQPPQFEFVNATTNTPFNQDENLVSYTNETSVMVKWSDPTNTDYLAKINKEKIYYYKNGYTANKTYISSTNDIVSNGKNHYFIINLPENEIPNGTIISVYMEYEGEITNTRATSITKHLYIDRQAPETVLAKLINSATIGNSSIAADSRRYVDNTDTVIEKSYKYNVPQKEGVLANYYFALPFDLDYLSTLLSAQPSTQVNNSTAKYYINGYNYFKKEFNIENDSITNISSVNSALGTHKVSVNNMQLGRYYEILETDLAGNVTIYLIYLVNANSNDVVLNYTKEDTDYNKNTNYLYGDLETTQNIYAKSYFNISSMNLYNYKWLMFDFENNTYFKTPNLKTNEFYDYSNWTNHSEKPNIVTYEDILYNSNPDKYVLTINNSAYTKNHTFNIFITRSSLSYTLIQTPNGQEEIEGIDIFGTPSTNVVEQFPVSMKIYSFENNKYVLIYDAQTFVSKGEVVYTKIGVQYRFLLPEPKVDGSYKYEFIDNYGIGYVEYHTMSEKKLSENEKIVSQSNTDIVKTDIFNTIIKKTDPWYVGFGDVVYNFSAGEYKAYIKVYYLVYEPLTNIFSYKEYIYESGTYTEFGCELVNCTTPYFEVTNSYLGSTIKQVMLFAQPNIENYTDFAGSSIQYIISLVNIRDNDSSIITDRVLVNNLKPNITLRDKNGKDRSTLIDGNTLYSGQISVEYAKKDFETNYVFPYSVKMIYNNGSESEFASGTIITQPGTYIINTYNIIDNQSYLVDSHTIIISEVSNVFYNVTAFNDATNMFDVVNTTGETFEYNNKIYYNHYIINTQKVKINVNENEGIEDAIEIQTIIHTQDVCTTTIYKITNENSDSLDIRPYTTYIAITFVTPTSSLLADSFSYDTEADGEYTPFTNISSSVVITTADTSFNELEISFNSFFAIPQNKLIPTIELGNNERTIYTPIITEKNGVSTFTLNHSGYYTISFRDIAGNTQLFLDKNNNYLVNTYTLVYIKGVAFEINGKTPIENAIYNDEVQITLPTILNSYYHFDIGGKPKIHVEKNGTLIDVNSVNGIYTIKGVGRYSVYFDATIRAQSVKQEMYQFTILSSKEYRTNFSFAEYANYRITKVLKNDKEVDFSGYFATDINSKALKNITLSLSDEITGQGNYTLTIKTNSEIANEEFTFSLIIKNIGLIPIEVSSNEGARSTDNIVISFNAYEIFSDIGECLIICGDYTYNINEEYLEELNSKKNNYYVTSTIERAGTYFIQVYSSSDKLLYSYKVVKADPLNVLSIILIVVGAGAVVGLTLTVTLLRKRMKIK